MHFFTLRVVLWTKDVVYWETMTHIDSNSNLCVLAPPHDWIAGGDANMAVLVVSLPGETEATGGLHHRVEGNQGVGTHVQRRQWLSREGGVGRWCGVRYGGQKDPSMLVLLPGEH